MSIDFCTQERTFSRTINENESVPANRQTLNSTPMSWLRVSKWDSPSMRGIAMPPDSPSYSAPPHRLPGLRHLYQGNSSELRHFFSFLKNLICKKWRRMKSQDTEGRSYIKNKRHNGRQKSSLLFWLFLHSNSITGGRRYLLWPSLFVLAVTICKHKLNVESAQIIMTTFAFRHVSYFLYGRSVKFLETCV